MNVLIVYAHPEPRSLNGSLKSFTVDRLTRRGHEVRVSDLYAMGWKPALDAGDFPARDRDSPLDLEADSKQAFTTGTQPPDVAAQQADLRWADAVIFQFPLWWYSMPAILKGWVERVYAYGFAYGVGEHSDRRWGDRFGEGVFQGKRALLIVTTGGWESHYSERGVNGPIDDLLFPITHGILHYPGFDVLPPFVVYRAKKMDDARFARIRQDLGRRLDDLWTDEPIAYRKQNGGDYDIPALTLKPGLEWAAVSDGDPTGPRADGGDRSASAARADDAGAARASGFRLHIRPRA
ncbi:NAD(P)H-dependent oxidoreductase [Sorangium sp. So ce388]|uniref:NAD(P)H-dependent oxidoreductase n=1 Tax=Sorangium sp. So ce388 TaxID=3133309 RepID=UPI003F5BE7C0